MFTQLLQKLFTSKNKALNDPENMEKELNKVWKELCAEYNVSAEEAPLLFTTQNDLIENETKRLRSLNIYTKPKGEITGLGNYARPVMLASSNIGFVNGRVKVTILGVFIVTDVLYPHFDRKKYFHQKINAAKMILKHEMGHILSFRSKFDGILQSEYNEIKKWIDDENDKVHKQWDADPSSISRTYYQLPLEKWANEAAGIKEPELSFARYIIQK